MPRRIKWLGMADAAGYTAVVLADNQKDAELLLHRKWMDFVGTDFAVDNKILTFQMLADFNGATVRPLSIGTAAIWEQIQ